MKFVISDQRSRQGVIDYLQKLPDDGKHRDVAITLRRIKRTIPQNRLYRLWIGLIADETGNNPDDLHEAFKLMFLGTKEVNIGGAGASIPVSTTALDTTRFTHFLEQLEAWVTAELGIILPRPEDRFWADFQQKYGEL